MANPSASEDALALPTDAAPQPTPADVTAGRKPFPQKPNEFSIDPRVHWDKESSSFKLEDENEEEWEWNDRFSKWTSVVDPALIQMQQSAYKMAGVDEDEPANDPRKRKAAGDAPNAKAKKARSEEPRRNTAIYLTNLPDDTDEDELFELFSRYGIIAEGVDDDKPRIKLYYDDNGEFKREALIVYFRYESVINAINLCDDSDLRMGRPSQYGHITVQPADDSFKKVKDQIVTTKQVDKKGSDAWAYKQKAAKKYEEMNRRLADWGDEDDVATMPETSSRWDKVVIFKNMFTLDELAEDPAAMLEIKEDMRDECAKCGQVTNVVLYDKEEDGVITVRFSTATAANAAVEALRGRRFGGRQVIAYIADGGEKFKKSSSKQTDDADELQRLENFSKHIEKDKQ